MDDRLLEELREVLPRLVREHPEIVAEIQIRIRDAFASKDDLRAVIDAFNRRTEELHGEVLARFEAVDRRFEAMQADMDRRFEAADRRADQRHAEMLARFEAVDRRFEAVDRRFEAMQADMDRRFEAVLAEFRKTNQSLVDLKSWVKSNVGGLERRAGKRLEDTIAGTLRFVMGVRDLRADQLRLRQKVRDEQGIIGPKGRQYEYDILAADGETIVFEIKSVPDVEDVERFADKARLVEESLGRHGLRKVLVTLDKAPEIAKACERLGIVLV